MLVEGREPLAFSGSRGGRGGEVASPPSGQHHGVSRPSRHNCVIIETMSSSVSTSRPCDVRLVVDG
ncbi:hypothetical protein [Actinomadura oligospora]|uniref:hypothetical protein n=1 Tax=Actinomadura oligospora TaxID=111804 RepID=UPI0004AC9ACD|nr:hypothetical protein [Actinomadura oligospora]